VLFDARQRRAPDNPGPGGPSGNGQSKTLWAQLHASFPPICHSVKANARPVLTFSIGTRIEGALDGGEHPPGAQRFRARRRTFHDDVVVIQLQATVAPPISERFTRSTSASLPTMTTMAVLAHGGVHFRRYRSPGAIAGV